MNLKQIITLLFLIIICQSILAQKPVKNFTPTSFSEVEYSKFSVNKSMPNEMRPQVLTALSYYPELSTVNIVFRMKESKTPLTSRPTFWSLFKAKKNRTYQITISTKAAEWLNPILFANLPYNAQIGVLGHEISHVADYNDKNFWQLLRIGVGMLSKKYTDKFEFNTDMRCVEHGLGYQLKSWSVYTRMALDLNEWKGAGKKNTKKAETEAEQRYMNPSTIEKYMQLLNIYNK